MTTAEEWVIVVWGLFNYFEVGCPVSEPSISAAANRCASMCWTARHSDRAKNLFDDCWKFCRVKAPEGPNRGIAALLKQLELARARSYDRNSFLDLDTLVLHAGDVDPQRIAIPEAGAVIDPANHLQGDHLSQFLSMADWVPEPNEASFRRPKPCHKVSPSDEIVIAKKLLENNLAVLVSESDVLKDGTGAPVVAGFFTVPHKPNEDRLITDRRPQNSTEQRLGWARLPQGPLLAQLILHPWQSVRGSADDISNYFHLLKHLDSWIPRNAVGRPLEGNKLLRFGADPQRRYYIALKTIPMGDLNGVCVAQGTHEAILREVGCIRGSETLQYEVPTPVGSTWEGLCIDDHIIVQKVAKGASDSSSALRDDEILAASRQHYKDLRIPVSSKKAVTKAYEFQAWGTHVDSNSGRVGAPLEKLCHLVVAARQFLQLPAVNRKLLQRLVGLFVHPFMHRRECMSVFQETYKVIERLPKSKLTPIPQQCQEELLWATLLLPFAHACVRWPVSNALSATDATLSHAGRAVAQVPAKLTEVCYRFAVHKGEGVRLDWACGALMPISSMVQAPNELEEALLCARWRVTERSRFKTASHINVQEMKVAVKQLTASIKKCSVGQRLVNLCDSRVVCGAWAKGRSSSRKLNSLLRRVLGHSVAGRKSLVHIWVSTKSNPADYPSRNAPIPQPQAPTAGLKVMLSESELQALAAKPQSRTRKKCSC